MVISITTYYLAASLVDLGMSWWQGILTVFVGNVSEGGDAGTLVSAMG
jgi:NCS1 family nucleobase:cation symporter-1